MNNGDPMPGFDVPPTVKNFNSYNQPSVNAAGLVVFRARGKGPGEPPHGVFVRDMGASISTIVKIADRTSEVPDPNDTDVDFIEFPSFPRIDIDSGVLAFRGNHPPVYLGTDGEALGTTGIYSNPGGLLLTGAAKLGSVPEFSFFEVPGASPGTPFDVFPGAPAVTGGNIIVFKGNYTEDSVAKTGVYYRVLEASTAGGTSSIQLIANTSTPVPGTAGQVLFGSTAPPSAANGRAVFAGFDDEDVQTHGGIYLAPLTPSPTLTPLVSIGAPVPDWRGEPTSDTFHRFGEGLSFEGRFVGFWAAWGTETEPVVVHCPDEGNVLRQRFCLSQCPEPGGCTFQVPAHQGIFVHDVQTGETRMAAQSGPDLPFRDFLFWTFSGKVPGQTGEDEGEPARWRPSAFVAVEAIRGGTFDVVFKVSTAAGTQALASTSGPGRSLLEHRALVETGMSGTVLDPEAIDASGNALPITELGIERDGLRNGWLAISARMGSDEGDEAVGETTGWAGIYVNRVGLGR